MSITNFLVENVGLLNNNVIKFNSPFSISFTFKHDLSFSSSNIKTIRYYLWLPGTKKGGGVGGVVSNGDEVFSVLVGSAAVDVAKGATKTVTIQCMLDEDAVSGYGNLASITDSAYTGIKSGFAYTTSSSGTTASKETYPANTGLSILRQSRNPIISELTASRYNSTMREYDDEGEDVSVTYKLNTDDNYSSFKLAASATNLAEPQKSYPLTAITKPSAGVSKTVNITNSQFKFLKSNDWKITLTLSDSYETYSLSTIVPKAFANMHLSGQQVGGVCFGGFSTVTNEDETGKLESYFPAYFYNGIADIKVKQYSDLTYASGFEAYAEHEPRVTRVGCMVFLDGMITTTKTSAATSSAVTMATLPDWAKPRVRVNALQQGSTSNIWWLQVTPDGNICVQRYRQTNSTSYTTIASGAQLPVSACWIAADAYD